MLELAQWQEIKRKLKTLTCPQEFKFVIGDILYVSRTGSIRKQIDMRQKKNVNYEHYKLLINIVWEVI